MIDLGGLAGKIVEAALGKGTIEALIERFLPKTMTEEERKRLEFEVEQFRAKTALEVQKALTEEEAAFRESVNAYENPAGLSRWMLDFRASVRPTITYAAFILLAYILIWGGRIDWARLDGIPQNVWWIFLAIFSFWFGGRAVSDARNGKNS